MRSGSAPTRKGSSASATFARASSGTQESRKRSRRGRNKIGSSARRQALWQREMHALTGNWSAAEDADGDEETATRRYRRSLPHHEGRCCPSRTPRDGAQPRPPPIVPRPTARPDSSNNQGQRRPPSRTRGCSRATSRRAEFAPALNTRGRPVSAAGVAATEGAAGACETRRGRVCAGTGRVKAISRGRSKQPEVIFFMTRRTPSDGTCRARGVGRGGLKRA